MIGCSFVDDLWFVHDIYIWLMKLRQQYSVKSFTGRDLIFFLVEFSAPSKAPENFTVTAHSSTSITAYWQLPPTDSRNGIIVGFKLFYKKIDSAASATMIILNNGTINIRNVTGLDEYAEYEFQLLAFTPVGDGPKSSLQFAKTMEDGKRQFVLRFPNKVTLFYKMKIQMYN